MENVRRTYIYCLIDPRCGSVRYIGKSNNPQKRWYDHVEDRGQTYKARWVRSVLACGYKPILGILEEVDEGDWREAEQRWILLLKDEPLTNLTPGGEGLHNPSEETRKRMSIAAKGNKNSVGRKHSPESRERIRQAKLGKPLTPEWRKKISESLRNNPVPRGGWRLSEEARMNIGRGHLGHSTSPETRAKISAALMGNTNGRFRKGR